MSEQRNMAMARPLQTGMPKATWNDWQLSKAVKEGYKVSGWVFRAVSMVAKTAASAPWVIYNEDNEIEPDHPLAALFAKPNPSFTRQDVFELLIMWQQLTGEGFLYGPEVNGQTKELWPTSPDRLAPMASTEPDKLISGYEELKEGGKKTKSETYTPENTMHFKLLDPSNPLRGIGPLQVAARAVDTDSEQQDWNKSAMQNRGVMDGVFTFDRDIDTGTFDTLKKMIKERFGGSKNARQPGIIGSAAKYTRMSLSPVEMDFLLSRKFNREEIFIIFGVPAQLAGVTDAMTYNNYSEGLRILWENTNIPLLDDMADTFNHHFSEQLEGKYRIGYDTSNVAALKDNEDQRAKTGKAYFDMGVPVKNINEKLNLGLTEFEGWDKPFSGTRQSAHGNTENRAKK